jgi:hypothetical protein
MSKPVAFAREGDDDYGYTYLVRDASDTRNVKGDDATARLYTPYDHTLGDEKWIQDIIKFSFGDWRLYTGPTPAGLDEAWAAIDSKPAKIKVRRDGQELGKADWEESKHPRDKGKFATKEGAGAEEKEAPDKTHGGMADVASADTKSMTLTDARAKGVNWVRRYGPASKGEDDFTIIRNFASPHSEIIGKIRQLPDGKFLARVTDNNKGDEPYSSKFDSIKEAVAAIDSEGARIEAERYPTKPVPPAPKPIPPAPAPKPMPDTPVKIVPTPGYKETHDVWTKHNGYFRTKVTHAGGKLHVWAGEKGTGYSQIGEFDEGDSAKAFDLSDRYLKARGKPLPDATVAPTPAPAKPVKVTPKPTPAPAPEPAKPEPTARKTGADIRALAAEPSPDIAKHQSLIDGLNAQRTQIFKDYSDGKLYKEKFVALSRQNLDELHSENQTLSELKAKESDAFKQHLVTPTPSKVGVDLRGRWEAPDKAKVAAGYEAFQNFVSADVLSGVATPVCGVKHGRSGRACYVDSENAMQLSKYSNTTSVVHELGHWLEHHAPAVGKAARDFLRKRAAGEHVMSLGAAVGVRGYGKGERCYKDKFPDAYCGKVYPTGDTEIISMGFQYMHEDPIKFAKADPEYFDFMYDVMSGAYK